MRYFPNAVGPAAKPISALIKKNDPRRSLTCGYPVLSMAAALGAVLKTEKEALEWRLDASQSANVS
jgi:hypothetical protein